MRPTVQKKMPHVAVVLESAYGVSRAMLQGIFDYVRVYGPWSLNVIEGGLGGQQVPAPRLWKGDGIIARVPDDVTAKALLASRLPTVLFNPPGDYLERTHPLSRYSRTQLDSEAIGALAADYFLGRSPRAFVYVDHTGGAHWTNIRREAFCARLRQAGKAYHIYPLPPKDKRDWVVERPRLCAWLQKLPKPMAIFAANDTRGREVLDACLVAGIAVPYEATVLGVDNDTLVCETSIPPLSSIAADTERAGYEAARLLDRLMHKMEKPGRVVRFGPKELVARASTADPPVADKPIADKRVIRALEFVRINAGLNIRVSDVAEHLGVSPRWAENLFKQTVGQSLHQWIHEVRMASVRNMVTATDSPFSEIAKRCGFRNVNYLCRIFKRTYGSTMTRLRQADNRRMPSRPS